MPERESVMDQINRLANERQAIYRKASHQRLSEADLRRLREIESQLNQLWQRRRMEKSLHRDYLDLLIERSYKQAA